MNSDAETIKEIAVTTGKAIDAAKTFGGFVSRFIGGPLEQAMGIFEDKLKYRRFENQAKLMEKVNKLLKKNGLTSPNRPVPTKIAIPIFENASVEDQDSLHTLWANLLVNAGNADSGVDIEMVYVDILKSITPLEAKIMECVYSVNFEEFFHESLLTKNLPNSVAIRSEKLKDVHSPDFQPTEDVTMALANLDRLRCLTVRPSMGGGQIFSLVNPTLLGKKFVLACSEHVNGV